MSFIGSHALALALVTSLYSALLFFAGAKRPRSPLIRSAERAVRATFALVVLASLALVIALLNRDFRIEYVAQYSNRSLPLFYTLAAFWAGQAGSLLFWCLLLSVFAALAMRQYGRDLPDYLPYTLGVVQTTTFFFLILLTFISSPFKLLPFTPPDGQGLNPLLQNPAMVFHPPALYIGFVGYTVPFAAAVAALILGRFDALWLKSLRRWSLFSWLFLTLGNVLGMQWAYVELGWGGYWAWDPVENASLMPWLTGTAFLHSLIVQERKGVLKRWTLALILLTFALTIFGTFVTRSGLIASVHAFGVSNLGPMFLLFLAVVLFASFALLLHRSPLLKGRQEIASWTSKESSFLLTNVLFVALTVGVLTGVLLPTITEALGEKLTVTQDYFNRMAAPIAMAAFLLIGICSLLPWSAGIERPWARQPALPLSIAAVTGLVSLLLGACNPWAAVALMIAAFSLAATLQVLANELNFGRLLHYRPFSAFTETVGKRSRRIGAYVVHFGVLCFFIGIVASSSFSQEASGVIHRGESLEIGPYRLQLQQLDRRSRVDRVVDAAVFLVLQNGRLLGTVKAERHLFENFQPATEVGIYSTIRHDVYVILEEYDLEGQQATVTVLLNPLVMWIWIGAGIMTIGVLIGLGQGRRKESE
ncbi:MAG: heme lyase CcmF/NrfE family subunit [candidate division KSB1 bacterium]|nr:heme lyase CcmF/NrfE family subunit [candidate division KSB1 bacterium]